LAWGRSGKRDGSVIPKEARSLFAIRPGARCCRETRKTAKPGELRGLASRIPGNLNGKKENRHEP